MPEEAQDDIRKNSEVLRLFSWQELVCEKDCNKGLQELKSLYISLFQSIFEERMGLQENIVNSEEGIGILLSSQMRGHTRVAFEESELVEQSAFKHLDEQLLKRSLPIT